MTDWYLYIIKCKRNTLYTGIAIDVDRRLQEHRDNGKKGAKYLRGRGPLELVYQRKIGEKGLALRVERMIKHLSKSAKEDLVCGLLSIEEMMSR